MKKYFVYFVLLSVLFSCKKSNTRLYGKVTNGCTGNPVGGVNVILWSGEKLSGHYSFIDSVKTYSDGSFDFSFRAGVLDNNYWLECGNTRSDYVVKKTSKEVNLTLTDNAPTSYLNINIINTSPYNSNDSIYIDVVSPNSNNPTFHNQFFYTGMSVNAMKLIGVDGCSPRLVNLSWKVTKNNITTSFSNSISCPDGATVPFQLNY